MIPQNLPAKWGYKATKNEKAEGLHWGEKPVNLSGPIRFYLGGRAKNRRSCAQFSVPHLPVDLTTSNLCKFQSPPHPKLGDSEPRPSPWTVQTPQNHLAKTHKPWQALTICSSGPSIPELVTPQKMDLQWPSTDSTHRIPTSMDSHGQVALTLYFTSLQAQFTTCVTSGCSSNLGYGAMVPKRLDGSMLMWIKHDKTMPYFYHPFSWEC